MPLKTALNGIPRNSRNSPLLAALGFEKVEQLIKRQQLIFLRNALQGNSKARTFLHGNKYIHVCDNEYKTYCQRKLKTITRDGDVYSVMLATPPPHPIFH